MYTTSLCHCKNSDEGRERGRESLGLARMRREKSPERVPDWLLGGHVRRRVLEALDEQGWTAIELAEHINAAEPTVFEVFRAMKPLGGIEPVGPRGTYRLSHDGIGSAVRALIQAAKPFEGDPVSQPPSRRG